MDDAQRARAAANKAAAMLKIAARKRKAEEEAAAAAPPPATTTTPTSAKRARTDGSGGAAGSGAPGCEICGRGPPDATLERVFSVSVCAAHKREHHRYDLVGAGDAAATYLLPKSTLNCLKCHERANPRQPTWKPMKLYLRRDLEEQADRRWGDAAGLDAERRRRDVAKVAKAERKAANFFERPPG